MGLIPFEEPVWSDEIDPVKKRRACRRVGTHGGARVTGELRLRSPRFEGWAGAQGSASADEVMGRRGSANGLPLLVQRLRARPAASGMP